MSEEQAAAKTIEFLAKVALSLASGIQAAEQKGVSPSELGIVADVFGDGSPVSCSLLTMAETITEIVGKAVGARIEAFDNPESSAQH